MIKLEGIQLHTAFTAVAKHFYVAYVGWMTGLRYLVSKKISYQHSGNILWENYVGPNEPGLVQPSEK